MLDLWQQSAEAARRPQANEGGELPATFGESYDAAWSQGELASSSIKQTNARNAAIAEFSDQIKAAGGDVDSEYASRLTPTGGESMMEPDHLDVANTALAKLKAKNPGVQIAPLTQDDVDKRAVQLSQGSVAAAQQQGGREQSFASRAGSFLGASASSFNDPMNLPLMAIAPEDSVGILGHALQFGGGAAVSQAANELMNRGYNEQVQPGYGAQGVENVVEAGLSGAALGGGLRAFGKVLEGVSTRFWPTATRDAANVVRSEAQIDGSNVLSRADGQPPDGTVRLYRGETAGGGPILPGSDVTGGWFTTSIDKARRFGDVSYVDVPRSELGSFVQGHGGADEFLTDNPKFRAGLKPLADPVAGEAAHREALGGAIDSVLKGDAVKPALPPAMERELDRASIFPAGPWDTAEERAQAAARLLGIEQPLSVREGIFGGGNAVAQLWTKREGGVPEGVAQRFSLGVKSPEEMSEAELHSVMSHELGHAVDHALTASPEEKAAIQSDYERAIESSKGQTVEQYLNRFSTPENAKARIQYPETRTYPLQLLADKKPGFHKYFTSRREWFADQVAGYLSNAKAPFEQSGAVRDFLDRRVRENMPAAMPEDAKTVVLDRIRDAKTPDEARWIANQINDRPQTLADTMPTQAAFAAANREAERAAPQPPTIPSDQVPELLTAPDAMKAQRADVERAIDAAAKSGKALQIPIGVDAAGEPIMGSATRALTEIDKMNELADQIAQCALPGAEQAAE